MQPTPLQIVMGLGFFGRDTRATAEFTLALITGVAMLLVRGNRRVLRAPTLAMLSIGFLLDFATMLKVLQHTNLPRLGAAAALALVSCGVIKLLLDAADSAAHRSRAHFSTIFKDLLMMLLFAMVVMAVLTEDIDIDPMPLLASSAVVAVVLGFALQETLGNVFSGITLQLGKPFAPGDWVRSGSHLGRVQGISWRSTTVITRANEKLEIPNATLAKDLVINYSNGIVADEISIGLSYEAPPNYVREVVLEALHDVPGVLQSPPPDIYTWEYADYAVRYRIKYWVGDYADVERVHDAVTTSLWYLLRRKAIEIPYPIRTFRTQTQSAITNGAEDFERQIMTDLRQIDFLRDLRDDELRLLLPGVTVLKFGAGEVIVREGDQGDSLYMIRRGAVAVFATGGEGKQVHLRDLAPPAFFGEMALMTGEPRTATIRARADAELLEVGRDAFTELFKSHPESAARMGEVIALRMNERRELLVPSTHDDGVHTRARWLLNKMRTIFNLALTH